MKYSIYAKFAQLNSVFFCLDLEFFHHFPLLDLSKGRQLLSGIMVEFDQCAECISSNINFKNSSNGSLTFTPLKIYYLLHTKNRTMS